MKAPILDAPKVRIDEETVRVFPGMPDWSGDARQFATMFTEVVGISFPQVGPTPKKQFIGEQSPQRCAFCGRARPEVSFAREAHTLPASLGNRHSVSREECDSCNTEFGELYDDAMAKWLFLDRIFAGTRRRKGEGRPSFSGGDGAQIVFDDKSGIVITTDPARGARSVEVERIGENELEITAHKVPGYSIDYAMRNFARIAWFFLSDRAREKHRRLLSIVRREHSPAHWECWRLFVPGNDERMVRLHVWEAASDVEIPPVLVCLRIGSSSLFWASPDHTTGAYRRCALPAFDCRPKFGDPTIHLKTWDVGAIVGAHSSTTRLGFGELVPALVAAVNQLPQVEEGTPRTLPVVLRWRGGTDESSVRTALRVQRHDDRVTRFVLSGNELCGELLVHSEPLRNKSSCEVRLRIEGELAEPALKTATLLRQWMTPGQVIRIFTEDGQDVFSLANASGLESLDLDKTCQQLSWLVHLSKELSIPLRVSPDLESMQDARTLYIASTNGGVVEVGDGSVSFVQSFSNAEKFLASAAHEAEQALVFRHRATFRIGEVEIDPGEVTLKAMAKLARVENVERNGVEARRLVFAYDEGTFEFARWLRSGNVSTYEPG